jgi:hypothetical protein
MAETSIEAEGGIVWEEGRGIWGEEVWGGKVC